MDLARGTLNSELKMVLQRGQRLIRELVGWIVVGLGAVVDLAVVVMAAVMVAAAVGGLVVVVVVVVVVVAAITRVVGAIAGRITRVIVGATFLPPCAMFILPSFSCFLACNSLHILAFSLPYTAAKRRVRANRLSLMMASCRFNSQLSQRPSAFFFQQS
ncbi:hypothetical protein Pcinc_023004 [Petrolisthes cinctipes]|uniref:Uncharacterized protein n=1 Tax=Petrolisthes cinctipes TaxID=88211 RepID=A0AAE1KHF9_PETCI|nr:hypothetical protein Pcinc_023004 [Petrolisthes cinctipes]